MLPPSALALSGLPVAIMTIMRSWWDAVVMGLIMVMVLVPIMITMTMPAGAIPACGRTHRSMSCQFWPSLDCLNSRTLLTRAGSEGSVAQIGQSIDFQIWRGFEPLSCRHRCKALI